MKLDRKLLLFRAEIPPWLRQYVEAPLSGELHSKMKVGIWSHLYLISSNGSVGSSIIEYWMAHHAHYMYVKVKVCVSACVSMWYASGSTSASYCYAKPSLINL